MIVMVMMLIGIGAAHADSRWAAIPGPGNPRRAPSVSVISRPTARACRPTAARRKGTVFQTRIGAAQALRFSLFQIPRRR